MLRLRQVALVADRLAPVVDDLCSIFDLEVAFRDPGVARFGLENAVLPVGSQFVEVVAPVEEGTAAGRYLQRRGGEGGYMVILQCDDHPPVKRRIAELGIRTVVEHDDDGYSIMQLHPSDTGGSFLEIDVQAGGEAPDGPWTPAGPTWARAVRTDAVRAIAAVDAQSARPDELASRWGAILDRPAVDGVIELDEDATIRFTEADDGRGEGLGGVDLVAADHDGVLRRADARGAPRTGPDTVLVGGVRFRLV